MDSINKFIFSFKSRVFQLDISPMETAVLTPQRSALAFFIQ